MLPLVPDPNLLAGTLNYVLVSQPDKFVEGNLKQHIKNFLESFDVVRCVHPIFLLSRRLNPLGP